MRRWRMGTGKSRGERTQGQVLKESFLGAIVASVVLEGEEMRSLRKIDVSKLNSSTNSH
ncbi:hypothetical protein H6G64_09775 [Calothrix sp. FACHB-156]|nr:hypothetical protein [Calothrix sp. FACHB-156]